MKLSLPKRQKTTCHLDNFHTNWLTTLHNLLTKIMTSMGLLFPESLLTSIKWNKQHKVMMTMMNIWVSSKNSMINSILKRWWRCWKNRMNYWIRYMQRKAIKMLCNSVLNRTKSKLKLIKQQQTNTTNCKNSSINYQSMVTNITKSIQILSTK